MNKFKYYWIIIQTMSVCCVCNVQEYKNVIKSGLNFCALQNSGLMVTILWVKVKFLC